MPPDPNGPFGVPFVCTGNICRSPTAEALDRRELTRRRVRAADLILCMAAEHARELDGDDVDDPLGPPAERYAACAERLDGLVTPVIAALVKTMAVGSAGPT
jgi:protein-tyrosine-phosphatase